MRTVTDIYREYRIPVIVQAHQLRVAAVGELVAKHVAGLDAKNIVRTGLFHDAGNILKMDLSPGAVLLPLIAPDTVEELRAVQAECREKYGNDEHAMSIAVGRAVGLPEEVLTMIDNMRFSRTEWVLTEAPIEMKIIKYADLRVSPYGIVAMRERLDEAAKRYRGRSYDTGDAADMDMLERTEAQCFELERVVCDHAGIDPTSITDEAASPAIEMLRGYTV
jgi:hypothetical protein